MDMFAEQLVQKKQDNNDTTKKLIVIIGGSIAVALSLFLMFVIPFTFIFGAGIIYLMYMFLTGLNIEYEYAVTNGMLDIDKIIAKKKRVGLISVEVKNFTSFGKFSQIENDNFDGVTILTVGNEYETYYAEFTNETHGNVRLVFTPDEKIIECIKPFLPRNLK